MMLLGIPPIEWSIWTPSQYELYHLLTTPRLKRPETTDCYEDEDLNLENLNLEISAVPECSLPSPTHGPGRQTLPFPPRQNPSTPQSFSHFPVSMDDQEGFSLLSECVTFDWVLVNEF